MKLVAVRQNKTDAERTVNGEWGKEKKRETVAGKKYRQGTIDVELVGMCIDDEGSYEPQRSIRMEGRSSEQGQKRLSLRS